MPQQQLNESIRQTRQLMQMIQTSSNPQLVLQTLIQQNPYLALIVSQGNLKALAKQMADANNIDLNNLINELSNRKN